MNVSESRVGSAFIEMEDNRSKRAMQLAPIQTHVETGEIA